VRVGGVMQAAPAPRFDRTPAAAPAAPGAPGQDTQAVLADLGYDADRLEAMRKAGVLT